MLEFTLDLCKGYGMHNDAIIDNNEVVVCIININTEHNKSQVTNADGLVS